MTSTLDDHRSTAETAMTPEPGPRRPNRRFGLLAGAAVVVVAVAVGAAALGAGGNGDHTPLVANPGPESTSSLAYRSPVRLADALPNVYWQDGLGRRAASVDVFVGDVVDVVAAGGWTPVGPYGMAESIEHGECDDTAQYCSLLIHITVTDPLGGPSTVGDVLVAEARLRGPAYGLDESGVRPDGMAGPEDLEEWETRLRGINDGFWLLFPPTSHPDATGIISHPQVATVDADGTIVPYYLPAELSAPWFGTMTSLDAVRTARTGPDRTIDANAESARQSRGG